MTARSQCLAAVVLSSAVAFVAIPNVATDAAPATPPTPELTGFVVMPNAAGTAREALAPAQPTVDALVRSTLGDTWRVERDEDGRVRVVPGRGTAREALGGAAQGASARVPSASEAWERAHTISSSASIAYAEPTFAVTVNAGEMDVSDLLCPPCVVVPDKTSKCHHPIDGALRNPEWSLDAQHGANVIGAWKKFDDLRAKYGANVTVAQPDTGYTRHPEIWPHGDTSGVTPELGWNFITNTGWDPLDPTSGPFDTLLDGFLRNPSHGTKTSSVIVSPRGSQLTPPAAAWVSGVAPDATLIPLRVAEGVVLFGGEFGDLKIDMSRLADAIRAAAGPNRQKVKRQAHVISISMGGLPGTADLADAVAYAESMGVIVVAAAGNEVPDRRVVFPAAYKSVVAVAASNYDSQPWTCSSHGPNVKATAPGESVWTAGTRPGKTCVQAGDGTSFATATTAGVAALWLSYPEATHKQALDALPQNARPAAFRQALKGGVRSQPWGTNGFAGGIVDAVRVLDAPITSGARESFEQPWCPGAPQPQLASLESTFAAAPDGKRRVDRLLNGADICRQPSVAGEISFWYGVDRSVMVALNRLSERAEPGERDYDRARKALRAVNPSAQLRNLLR